MSEHLERLKKERDGFQGWLSPLELSWLISEVERLEDENRFLAKALKRAESEAPAAANGGPG